MILSDLGTLAASAGTGSSMQIPTPTAVNGFLQTFTQGMILVQVVKYWEHAQDAIWLKLYIGFILILSLLQTALQDYKLWRVAIIHKPWETSSIKWLEFFLNAFIVTVCTAYLIQRCWKILKKRLWVLLSLGVFCLSLQIANIVMSVTIQQATYAKGDRALSLMRSSILGWSYWTYGTLVLNGVLTTIIISFLWRSRTGLRTSDRVLWHVFRVTWESALLPAISMSIAMGLYHNSGEENQLVVLFLILTGKLYTIGLLRTLNSKTNFREKLESTGIGRTSLSGWDWQTNNTPTTATFVDKPALPLFCDPAQRDSLTPMLSSVSTHSALGTSAHVRSTPTLGRGGSADSRSTAVSATGPLTVAQPYQLHLR